MEYEKVNYHTHCSRCRHASGTAKEYAQEAVGKGLVKLGFSDHLPFPDDRLDCGCHIWNWRITCWKFRS